MRNDVDERGAAPEIANETLASGDGARTNPRAPLIVLAGPPGSGKSTLGRRACDALGLRFVELLDDGAIDDALRRVVDAASADVVAIPWTAARDARVLASCRAVGQLVALWAHPLEMQQRSGRTDALFTPVPRLHTHGGFGRRGTGCSEFRHLDRACETVLLVDGETEGDATELLRELIEDLRTEEELPPAEREGLDGWVDGWRKDFNADRRACDILVDAMARFTLHLKAQGTAPRKMSTIYSDLNAAGFLTMCSDRPKGAKVLEVFQHEPSEYEFRRKLTDSPRAFARYRATRRAFAAFLACSADVADGAQQ